MLEGQPESVPPPIPPVDPTTQFFWDGLRQQKLMILRCRSCGHYIHPPRPVCRFCLGTDLTPEKVSGRGTLYSWTVAVQAFHPWFADKLPYIIATIELVEEPLLLIVSNIVDCAEEDLRMGLPVQVAFREIAPGFTLPVFGIPGDTEDLAA
jgi:uncharacterized OB-fold protein